MRQALSLTRKELDSYFSSPMALIFVGVFLFVTLFTFFWVDSFFAQGIATVRALFEWMPILMIFLAAALTMRQWSEEEQSGTLQVLMTLPARLIQLVLGKFLSVLALVIVALGLTLFLPITVGALGNLDVGPVVGGYLASILMASAYIAIGLFISSRTDNQIVALILTVIACGFLQLIGSSTITDLFDVSTSEVLRALGTGSRFESIERGVIDLRDLVYYLSITVFFLTLNVFSLESKRWSKGAQLQNYRRNSMLTVALVGLNLLALNGLLYPITNMRLDLTEYKEYSLSTTTKDLLNTLQEPLLVRGYFSEDNHPLLAPLVPQIKDTLEEYRIASNGNMQVEFVDPITDPDVEQEANNTYGIRPTPLQVQERGSISLKNVYFDLLIRYGDQSVVLNFGDLIDVQNTAIGLDVSLRNIEYDLTKSIQRVVFGFQNIDAVLAALDQPAKVTLYITPDTLPDTMKAMQDTMTSVIQDMETESSGKLQYETIDVNAPDSPVTPQSLYDQYQIQPIPISFFSSDTFYFHVVVQAGDSIQVIYPRGELSEAEIRDTLESALKRSAPGFLKVVGLWTPPSQQQTDQFGQQIPNLAQYTSAADTLRDNYEVRQLDLTSGQVPADIDVLLVIAPQNMTDLERYAIDQYLMRGGSVMVAAGNYTLAVDPGTGGFAVQQVTNGLQEMLASYGITVEQNMVYDTQNEPFITPNPSQPGTFALVDYPPIIDVRPDGHDSLVLANLPAVSMPWTSSITLNDDLNADRTVTPLFSSSDKSWTTTNPNVTPNLTAYPNSGFQIEGDQQSYLLAASVQGTFESFFKDKPSPFEQADSETTAADQPATIPPTAPTDTETASIPEPIGLIETSPDTAKLVVIGSAEFLNDNVLNISQRVNGDRYLNNLQLVQNSVDWFVEDSGLASIRAGGSVTRILKPLTDAEQNQWEILNYAVALIALVLLGVVWRIRKQGEKPMTLIPEDEIKHTSTITPVYQGGD